VSEVKVLRKLDQAGADAVRMVERRVIRKMRRLIEEGAIDASRINDNGLDDQGSEVILSEQRKRIAMDLRKSKRHAPVYLDVYYRRVEGAERTDALRDGPKLNLNIGTLVQVQAISYPVKALEHKEEE
jgi:hypothetical protein